LDRNAQRATLEKFIQKTQDEVDKALTPEQTKRLKQIDWQLLGPGAFGNFELAKNLALTPRQQQQIEAIEGECAHPPVRPPPTRGGPPLKGRPEDHGKRFEDGRKKAMEKILNLLSAEQKKAYHDLLGEKFEGKFPFGPPPGPRSHQ
jgi:Spy/CpxP family protein refolding chaperone